MISNLCESTLPVLENGRKIYDIEYRDSFSDLSRYFQQYNQERKRRVCIVSDSQVASLYMDAIFHMAEASFQTVISFVFPEGEPSKNLNTVHDLYVRLIEAHFDRNDLLVALGGGVTGDLTGFAAATYLRGIRFIQLPTSLLADVDSSIGGKTGVDFDSYKNMVGAFHMPSLVYVNTRTLESLSDRQFDSGMGEVIKSALLHDADFFQYLESHEEKIRSRQPDAVRMLIYNSDVVKKEVVEFDPTETKGERAKLNLGHTLGHALEKYMNFQLLHGECVSIGCILAALISRSRGMLSQRDTERVISCFRNLVKLPVLPEDLDIDQVVDITKNDKKSDGASIKFILLNGIGHAVISTDVTHADMKQSLEVYMQQLNHSQEKTQ